MMDKINPANIRPIWPDSPYLVYNKLIPETLYLSEFFEKHRAKYFDALTKIRASNDISLWVSSFFRTVLGTFNKGIDSIMDTIQNNIISNRRGHL